MAYSSIHNATNKRPNSKAGARWRRVAIVCPIHTHTSTWRRPWTDRRTGEHTRTHCSRRGARTVTCRSCTTHAQSHPCTSATLHVAGPQRCSLHPRLKRQQRRCRSLCTVARAVSVHPSWSSSMPSESTTAAPRVGHAASGSACDRQRAKQMRRHAGTQRPTGSALSWSGGWKGGTPDCDRIASWK